MAKRIVSIPHKFRLTGAISFRKDYSPPPFSPPSRPYTDKFVAGCIIAKLPSQWRNFATTLKHKRQEISVENLIATLDVEEKARKKDVLEKGDQD